tara:strand:- start:147 stop:569 length:423 start_codon:yes stop_codon:yes gene_type:complete
MFVEVYLFFDGRCEEAIKFYQEKLGAKLDMLMRFSDSPDPIPADVMPPGNEDKIMHASFHIGDTHIMVSDGNCSGEPKLGGFTLSLTAADTAEADRLFNALAEEGKVIMPIGETFWSPHFGMVNDKFGVSWMVTVPTPAQ